MSFDPKDYPPNWKAIRLEILDRARYQCECLGECGLHDGKDMFETVAHRCVEIDCEPAKFANGIIMLTIAHLCHEKSCDKRDHLKAMCQRCHLRYDNKLHVKNAKETRAKKAVGE